MWKAFGETTKYDTQMKRVRIQAVNEPRDLTDYETRNVNHYITIRGAWHTCFVSQSEINIQSDSDSVN
jgi:hypothetical protein